jgi:hypothetical protein
MTEESSSLKIKTMTAIKIGLLAILFNFFAPVNSYAIIRQVTEIANPETRNPTTDEKGQLILAVVCLALGIYPFINGIATFKGAENVVQAAVGALVGLLGGLLLFVGLLGIGIYFLKKYRLIPYWF